MATSPIYSWPEPDNTDLVKNGALAIRTLGDAIDTTMATMVPKTIVDAKGDIIAATAADTVARLAVGTANQVLTVDSSTATGLKWATPAGGGGKVLQVVSATYSTETDNSSTTYADTGLTATITPTSASSKILVLVSQYYTMERSANGVNGGIILLRGSTILLDDSNKENLVSYAAGATAVYSGTSLSLSYYDSPATTSATTYKTQGVNLHSTGQVIIFQRQSVPSTITLLEIGA